MARVARTASRLIMIAKALAFLGRHATQALAVGVLLGLAFPRLAELARPLLIPCLVIPLTIALLRIDWQRMLAYGKRPALVGALAAWMLIASPLLMAGITELVPIPEALRTALVLMAAAPPIISASALGLILGLDAPLMIVVTVVTTALMPLTLPLMTLGLLGFNVEVGLVELMGRLGGVVAFAFLGAFIMRRSISASWVAQHAQEFDGFSVLNLVGFAIAIMAGVTATAIARPDYVLLVTVVAFAANLGLQVAGAGIFAFLGRREALSIGLLSGNCNMGLVLVTLADRADADVVIYFALAQIPMYMLPAALLPLYRRLISRA
jgi:BASS family bile acid:Na+ symporter